MPIAVVVRRVGIQVTVAVALNVAVGRTVGGPFCAIAREPALHMLERCRLHRPAVATPAQFQGTLAAYGAAGDVSGIVQRREEGCRAPRVLQVRVQSVPDRLKGA
jgi:hypothetical protein